MRYRLTLRLNRVSSADKVRKRWAIACNGLRRSAFTSRKALPLRRLDFLDGGAVVVAAGDADAGDGGRHAEGIVGQPDEAAVLPRSAPGVGDAERAFFAGIVVNESDHSHRAANELRPFQDAFAALFFVSVGMLFDPMIVVTEPLALLAVVAWMFKTGYRLKN